MDCGPGLKQAAGSMTTGARTPEELDTLIEDAFLQRDRAALEDLFDVELQRAEHVGQRQRKRAAQHVLLDPERRHVLGKDRRPVGRPQAGRVEKVLDAEADPVRGLLDLRDEGVQARLSRRRARSRRR